MSPELLSRWGGLSEQGARETSSTPNVWARGILHSCCLSLAASCFLSAGGQQQVKGLGSFPRPTATGDLGLEALHPGSTAQLLCDLGQGLPSLCPGFPQMVWKVGVAPHPGCTTGCLGHYGKVVPPLQGSVCLICKMAWPGRLMR